MGIDLGGGLLHPSLLRVRGQEGFPAPQFLVPGGGGMPRKEEGVERGHSPQVDPCGIVGESFWRLGEQLYFTLLFACASVSPSSRHICVSPAMQRLTPLPCPPPDILP